MKFQALTKFFLFLLATNLAPKAYAEIYLYYPNSTLYLGGNFDPSKPGEVFPECLKPSIIRHESGQYLQGEVDVTERQWSDRTIKFIKNNDLIDKQKNLIEAQKRLDVEQEALLLAKRNLIEEKKDASTTKQKLEDAEVAVKKAEDDASSARKYITEARMQLEAFTGMVVPAETKFFMKSVSTREELYKSLNISVSLSGNYGFFAGDLGADFEQKNTFDKNSFTWIIQGYSSFGKFMLEKVELQKKYKETEIWDATNFRNHCGTSYVIQEVRAAQASAVFTVRNISESDKTTLTAYLNAGYNAAGSSGQITSQLSNLIDRVGKMGEYEVSVYAAGGQGVHALAPIITNIADATAVLKILENYFKGLTVENAVAISYRTGSLQALRNEPSIDTEAYNKSISELYLTYADFAAEEEQLASRLKTRVSSSAAQFRRALNSIRKAQEALDQPLPISASEINFTALAQLAGAETKEVDDNFKNAQNFIEGLLKAVEEATQAAAIRSTLSNYESNEAQQDQLKDQFTVIQKIVRGATIELLSIQNVGEAQKILQQALDRLKKAQEDVRQLKPGDVDQLKAVEALKQVLQVSDQKNAEKAFDALENLAGSSSKPSKDLEKIIGDAKAALKTVYDSNAPSPPRNDLWAKIMGFLVPPSTAAEAKAKAESARAKAEAKTARAKAEAARAKAEVADAEAEAEDAEAKAAVKEWPEKIEKLLEDAKNLTQLIPDPFTKQMLKYEEELKSAKTKLMKMAEYCNAVFNGKTVEVDKKNCPEIPKNLSVQTGTNPTTDETFEKIKNFPVVGEKGGIRGVNGLIYVGCVPEKKQVGLRIEMIDGTKYFEAIKTSRASESATSRIRCWFQFL